MSQQSQFRKNIEGTIPTISRYYNNIRFFDNDFWKEVKFIRDVKTKRLENGMKEWFKVVQIMKMVVINQNGK